jgi:predicted DNA-binding transcriptional regulator AlpA
MALLGENEMNISEDSTVLSSWKDIARYLGKGVRTVQRWERHLGLPVRRPIGASQKSAVVLYRGDVDAWLATRFSARTLVKDGDEGNQCSRSARSTLKEGIRKARELRTTNQRLTEQIIASIRLLNERCDLLTTKGLQEPWRAGESVAWGQTGVPDLLPGRESVSNRVGSERIA